MFRSWPPQAFAGEQEKRFSLLFPGLELHVIVSYNHLWFFFRQPADPSERGRFPFLVHVPPSLLRGSVFSQQVLSTISTLMINTPRDLGKHSAEHNE